MEEKPDIRLTRINKEWDLINSMKPSNFQVIKSNTHAIEVKTLVSDSDVSFFFHVPDNYPFQQPKVSVSISENLTSLTEFQNSEDILEHVLGESWIPSINLPTVIETLVRYAHTHFKPKQSSVWNFLSRNGVIWIVLISIFLRCLVGLGSYSGYANPPKFGDYEAQRHWMEITYNLPSSKWYTNSTANDLGYWGIDYPPLTAWHSYILGWSSALLEPSSMTLYESRGYETTTHKVFMRMSVIISELITFIPAVICFVNIYYKHLRVEYRYATALLLINNPCFLIIDHGHFQYNNVMLGLVVWSIVFLLKNQLIFSAVLFTLALNFKQMSLYYALPMGVVLLKKSYDLSLKNSRFLPSDKKTLVFISEFVFTIVNIFGACVLTTLAIWSPYIGSTSEMLQVLKRIFPFQRGLFEDKVATFWCTASIFIKFREIFSVSAMGLICGIVTLSVCLPSLYYLLKSPSPFRQFLYSLNISMAFFLFSFHVHEKTILLPLLGISLYMILEDPSKYRLLTTVSMFSMYPLLVKDGLRLQYLTLQILYWVISGEFVKSMEYFTVSMKRWNLLYIGMIALHMLELVNPPTKYPYLFDLAISTFSFCVFCYVWVCNYLQEFRVQNIKIQKYFMETSLVKKPKKI
jgi:alpha-1,3-glucosyltransferase